MMKTMVGYLIATACATFVSVATAADNSGWNLVWSDEFNVDGAPNPEFWTFEKGFVRNKEPQWYQENNAYCKGGLLVIEARRERVKNPNYKKDSKNWTQQKEYAEITASSIKTLGKKEFQFCRVEVRARLPFGKGAWPAIWTVGSSAGDNLTWPNCGEIDMLELYHVKGVPSILANACWGSKNGNYATTWDTEIIPMEHFLRLDPDWLANFHVWRMDWDENFIRLYIDDELVNQVDLSKTINGKFGLNKNAFHRPHFFLLNLAIRSNDPVDLNAYPMKYEIDYIRVFQKKK